MKSTAIANSTGMQKFEFTAETATEVAALRAFERVLKTSPEFSHACFQVEVDVLSVSFQITPEELAQWREAAQ
jgi:hypothetical protein